VVRWAWRLHRSIPDAGSNQARLTWGTVFAVPPHFDTSLNGGTHCGDERHETIQFTTFNGGGLNGRLCRIPPFGSLKPAGRQCAHKLPLAIVSADPKTCHSSRWHWLVRRQVRTPRWSAAFGLSPLITQRRCEKTLRPQLIPCRPAKRGRRLQSPASLVQQRGNATGQDRRRTRRVPWPCHRPARSA